MKNLVRKLKKFLDFQKVFVNFRKRSGNVKFMMEIRYLSDFKC